MKLILALLLLAVPANAGEMTFSSGGSGSMTVSSGGSGTFATTNQGAAVGTTFVSDTFTNSDSTALDSHTGETGATWTEHPSYTAGNFIITSNRVRSSDGTTGAYYASGVPSSADYSVTASVYQAGTSITGMGPAGRMSTSADTMYFARFSSSSGEWQLYRTVAGTATKLGQYAASTSTGVTYTVKLEMIGTAIKVYINGTERISVTDSTITSAGRVGVRGASQTGGHHIADIVAVNN